MTIPHGFENFDSATPVPQAPVDELQQWVVTNFRETSNNPTAAMSPFPDMPDFSSRRERREYQRALDSVWHTTEEAISLGSAIGGLAEVVQAVRAQRAELAPPKKQKTPPHTPRHMR